MSRLLCFLFVPLLCSAWVESPDAVLKRAIELHQSGKPEQAIADYRKYLELNPKAVQVRSNLAVALVQTGQYDQAIIEYKKAVAQDPKDARIRFNLASAYYKSGQVSNAADELTIVQRGMPGDQRVALFLADCWLRMGENKKVVDLLSPLEGDSSGDPAFAYVYGTALIRDKQLVRGQQLVDRILKNGDSPEARLLMATAKIDVQDYLGAKADIEKAIELNPKLPDIYSMYGQVLMSLGDTNDSVKAFEKELETNPFDFTANLQLGATARQEQEYDKAMAYFQRSLRIRPDDPGALLQVANTLSAQGEREPALKILEKLTKDYPQFLEAHVTLATVYYRLGRKADGDKEREIVQTLSKTKESASAPAK